MGIFIGISIGISISISISITISISILSCFSALFRCYPGPNVTSFTHSITPTITTPAATATATATATASTVPAEQDQQSPVWSRINSRPKIARLKDLHRNLDAYQAGNPLRALFENEASFQDKFDRKFQLKLSKLERSLPNPVYEAIQGNLLAIRSNHRKLSQRLKGIEWTSSYDEENVHDLATSRGHDVPPLHALRTPRFSKRSRLQSFDDSAFSLSSRTRSQTMDQFALLLRAAADGDLVSVTELVAQPNININECDFRKWTALHAACFNFNLGIVDELLRAGAAVDVCNEAGELPLHLFVSTPCRQTDTWLRCITALSDHHRGVDVNARNEIQETCLHYAVSDHEAENTVDFLISHGADVNLKDKRGFTPLHVAIQLGNMSMVKCLLARGADVNIESGAGPTIHLAKKHPRIYEVLAAWRSQHIWWYQVSKVMHKYFVQRLLPAYTVYFAHRSAAKKALAWTKAQSIDVPEEVDELMDDPEKHLEEFVRLFTAALAQPSSTKLAVRKVKHTLAQASDLLREVRSSPPDSSRAQLWCVYHSFVDKLDKLPFTPSSPLTLLGSGEFMLVPTTQSSSSANTSEKPAAAVDSPPSSVESTPRSKKVRLFLLNDLIIVATVLSAYSNQVQLVIPTRKLVIEKVPDDSCALDLYVVGSRSSYLRLVAALPAVIEEWAGLLPLRQVRKPLVRPLVL